MKEWCDPVRDEGILDNDETICGTESYCRLFTRPEVLNNPDSPYTSESDCFYRHEKMPETEWKAKGMWTSPRGRMKRGSKPFHPAPCWAPYTEKEYTYKQRDEECLGTALYCAQFSNPFGDKNSNWSEKGKYQDERACLLDREAQPDAASNDKCSGDFCTWGHTEPVPEGEFNIV
ncbi:hypothetical protein JDV02_005508 [Purpureocillium takamizusanense]|uniref:Uncharacterized protein n=1 Tax=Purpureocillium takamizusanense TaxID=2060973 RepID=A0A9Q8QHG0_9HYPO|nr:uncharacterized protein JDV02_005508 [Purpureocillium takamizusanense]UNI19317.1 hypothetical protein JDV02_005508 [Purpureocillium takamizusanense]